MQQFWKILCFELKSFFKNKVFVGITLILVALLAAVMFFPRISSMFKSGSTSDSTADLPLMLIKADDANQSELILQSFSAAFSNYNVKLINYGSDTIKEQIVLGNAECAFIITGDSSYEYYVNNLSMYDSNADIANRVLQQIYQIKSMISSGMSEEEAANVMSIQITGRTENLGKNQIENFFYTYIMIFALYMVILLYGQMVATNVATEKSSRAMELLITSAKPASMMFGKVIASCLAGFVQLILVFGSALVFYNINKAYWDSNMIIDSLFNIPPELLVFMLVFFVLGFLIYAFMFGAVGSTASKLEDINTSVMPIVILFVIAFVVVMTSMSSGSVDNTVMKICSYIPFTSPMAMFTRIAMSTVPWYEVTASILILLASAIGIGFVSAKIYRVGVLLYGTKPNLGSVLKAVWKA